MSLKPVPYSAIDGWKADDHAAALATFAAAAGRLADAAPKSRLLGGDGEALRLLALAAREAGRLTHDGARRFFEEHFTPHAIEAEGFVTGYYEPEVEASLTPSAEFQVPLYRRPHDLIEIGQENRPSGWDPEMRFGRQTDAGVVPFYDRSEIEAGALDGRALELAWVKDAATAFFIHVQGSGRLKLRGGGTMRIAFDGKSGHAYTSIGRLAVQRGILPLERAHKDGLEAWLRSNPDEGRGLMRENRSFIFFRTTEQAEDEGPIGAAGVPLTAGRSLAIDRTLVTFHTPVWVDADGLDNPARPGQIFRRLMIAEDTGSAIVGPGRGDIFYGSGDRAGSLAGKVRNRAKMVLLLPKAVSRA